MAVAGGQRSNQFFIGLSGDPKPVTCDFSAQFYEWDTGKTYIWTGNNQVSLATPGSPAQGQWVEYYVMQAIPLDDNTDET
jgi:hypothetical protein